MRHDTAASDHELADLREQVARLLAAALQCDIDHTTASSLVATAHQAELDHLLSAAQQHAEDNAAERSRGRAALIEVDNLKAALESRDLIGQAKGVLIVAMRCTAETAFATLVQQSQLENRKLVDIAAEVVARAHTRARR